jgi:hypothetical protein
MEKVEILSEAGLSSIYLVETNRGIVTESGTNVQQFLS